AAQHFMEYLVGCALNDAQSIDWEDPLTHTVKTWEGRAGLCPDWELTAPSDECKHRVSACILARNNAFGRRVELSLRGENPQESASFALETHTAAVGHDPDLGMDVPSFQACTTHQSGMHRDCGWEPGWIGQCEPGETVRLGAGGVAPDQCGTGAALGSASGSRMMLRVCDGIIGCDESGARFLTQSEGTCGTAMPAVSFTCPASGYFNVMGAPYDSSQSGTVSVGVETGTPANTAYGSAEGEVFRYREGAFYGTIFDSKALATKVYVGKDNKVVGRSAVISGSVYMRMFSCYAPEWGYGEAYATHRVCALPGSGENCAATVTGACVSRSDPSYPASRCLMEDGPLVQGDGDFEECYDSFEGMWMEPVTVYLHSPCDLLPSPAGLCAREGEQI
ncbi:MAG TPA: hypothetical protein VLQ93_11580, partial [Myxococcaceae bacterium]|nr:hypothetical protein [Myxococcaceae bacterium]